MGRTAKPSKIPAWFDLKMYEQCKLWSSFDWQCAVADVVFALHFGDSDRDFLPLPPGDKEREASWVPWGIKPRIAETSSISELKNGDAEDIHEEIEGREKVWVESEKFLPYVGSRKPKFVDETTFRKYQNEPFENFCTRGLFLCVNIRCSDEQLMADFKLAVQAARQKKRLTSRHKLKFREKGPHDFKAYYEQRLLPYLHIFLFQVRSQEKLRDADVANALFPDDVEALDKFRKTTKPNALDLLNSYESIYWK